MKRTLRLFFLALHLLAGDSPSLAADNSPRSATSAGITEIAVQRSFCNGPCPIDTLLLRSDGAAEYTGMANTRLIGAFTGNFQSSDFDRLAQWLTLEGFYALAGIHGSPNVDRARQVIRVTRGGENESAISNGTGADLQLWAMGNVVRAVGADIQWRPQDSGIRGRVMRHSDGEKRHPVAGHIISIYPEGQQAAPSGSFSLRTDGEGRFEIALEPGSYTIASQSVTATRITAAVESGKFSLVEVRLPPPSEWASSQEGRLR